MLRAHAGKKKVAGAMGIFFFFFKSEKHG